MTQAQVQARVQSAADRERVIATITEAFRSDPICRWVWPDDAVYDRYFPPFVEAFGGAAFDHASAYATDGLGGAALWLPPGIDSDGDTLGQLAAESIDPARHEEVFTFLGQQEVMHPHEPLWYLPLIGVRASFQGQGLGSALLEHALEIVDREGEPAYLEATTERNRALYERHGFEVAGEIQHGSSPSMWPMYRKPR